MKINTTVAIGGLIIVLIIQIFLGGRWAGTIETKLDQSLQRIEAHDRRLVKLEQ